MLPLEFVTNSEAHDTWFRATAQGGVQWPVQEFVVPRETIGNRSFRELRAQQSICGVDSDWSHPTREGHGAQPGTPAIVEPVFGCANILVIDKAIIGCTTQAFDADSGRPLGDEVMIGGPDLLGTTTQVLHLWAEFGATETKRVRVQLLGCASEYQLHADVRQTPNPVSAPTIVVPVRPSWRSLKVKDCLVGAWIELFVDDLYRCRIKATGPEVTITLPGTQVFVEGTAFVRQRLCNAERDSAPVRIYKGKLDARAVPNPGVAGGAVVIKAVDAEFNTPLDGLPVHLQPNYRPGMVSGGSFSIPGEGTLPEKVVADIIGEPAYNNIQLSIPVIKPKQILGLHLRNNEFVNAPLKITRAAWTVRYDWGGQDAKEGIDANFDVPDFPQGTTFGRLYISLTIDWTAHGVVDGYVVRPASGENLLAVSNLEVGWPDPGYSGIFSVLANWLYRQTQTESWVEPTIAVVKDAETL